MEDQARRGNLEVTLLQGKDGVRPPLKGREDARREATTSVLHEADTDAH